MSKERIKISEDLYDIMPSDYQDLVKSATYGMMSYRSSEILIRSLLMLASSVRTSL